MHPSKDPKGKVIVTVRNEVAKVIFLQACVCPQGGGPASVHAGIHTPPKNPPQGKPPGSRHPPEQTTPPPRETATAADGTHPTGMHSC